MHRKVAGAAAAAALTLGLGAVGCGEDEAPTRAEFVRQADALCQEAHVESRKQRARAGEMSVVEFTTRAVASQRELVDDLEAVEPPEALATDYSRYVSALRAQNELTKQILQEAGPDSDGTLEPGSPAAVTAEKRDAKTREAYALAREIGMKDCTV